MLEVMDVVGSITGLVPLVFFHARALVNMLFCLQHHARTRQAHPARIERIIRYLFFSMVFYGFVDLLFLSLLVRPQLKQ